METLDQELITEDYSQYRQASKGKRFTNFLIDLIVFYLFIMLFGFTMGILQLVLKKDMTSWMSSLNPIVDRLSTMILYGIYYFSAEWIGKGKTIGKLITKTIAINEDTTPMNTNETLVRNFCRMIPFDQLSFLGQGWHDSISKTMVIDLNDKIEPVKNMHDNDQPERRTCRLNNELNSTAKIK